MSEFDPHAGQTFVGNDYVTFEGQDLLTVRNPSTLEMVGRVANTTDGVIEEVIGGARAAQRQWQALDEKTRALLLHDVANSIRHGDGEAVCEWMTREVGKPYPESAGELENVAPIFHYYADLARDDAGTIAGSSLPGTFQYKRYEPYGISAHIVPYNYPLLILAFTVAASLAAGNAVIVKPSEVSTLSTLAFMEHFKCLPPGVVSCVTGDGAVGSSLVTSEGTDVVAFTGSVGAARKVNMACAERMKPCIIESGGSDPIIVSDSADLEYAAAAVTCSSFHLSGQICTSSERVFVVESVHDEFVRHLVDRVRRLRVGDGFGRNEIGPLATRAARDQVASFVEKAKERGATVECGGRIPDAPATGWFYEPTVLTGLEPDPVLFQQELFGPVAPVFKVASVADGIARANETDFGLGGSIITTDLEEAMAAAEGLNCGMVWVNNPLVDNEALPFGGRKLSGLGRELGHEGLDAFRQVKYVSLDPRQVIQDWWYPYDDDVFHGSSA